MTRGYNVRCRYCDAEAASIDDPVDEWEHVFRARLCALGWTGLQTGRLGHALTGMCSDCTVWAVRRELLPPIKGGDTT